MKHIGLKAASFASVLNTLAVLSPLVGFAAGLAGALPARGADVTFTEHVISTTASEAKSVFATDVDGDGDIDVLSTTFTESEIAWHENVGGSPPSFTDRVITTRVHGGAKSVFATDLDSDGDIDVISAERSSDQIVVYFDEGGSVGIPPVWPRRSPIPTEALGATSVFAVDVNGDGDIDLLSAADSGDNIAWYENDGTYPFPDFTERVISTTASGAKSVFATDVDGDDDIDVLSASLASSKLAWYENNPAIIPDDPPTFTERVISEGTDLFTSVYATDLDGDTHTDVLSGAFIGGKIAWWESNGGSPPSFTERVISTGNNSGRVSVFAIDVDGDGHIDVLSASAGDGKIAWYENNPAIIPDDPPSFTEHVISTSDLGVFVSVFAIDVDGDGDIDVLSASGHKIAWYERTCGFDSNCDGDVDLRDFLRVLGTFGGLDAGNDVGLDDFAQFLEVFTGPAPP